MKLTKLIAVLFVASAICSCSKDGADGDTGTSVPLEKPSIVEGGTAEKPTEVSSYASIQDGNLVLLPTASNTIDLNKMINVGSGNTIGTNGFTATATITGTPTEPKGAVTLTPEAGSNMNLAYVVANYSSKDVSGQTIEIAVSKDGKYLATVKVPILIKATPLPADFTFTTQSGDEFMQMTTHGTITEDIDAFNHILKLTPNKGNSFGEAFVNFYLGGYTSVPPRLSFLTGAPDSLQPTKVLIGKVGAKCPPGFQIPTEAQYASITGNTKLEAFSVSALNTWYGTTTKHRIIKDNSGYTPNYQYIRNVEFGGKQMAIFYSIELAKIHNGAEAVQTFGDYNAIGSTNSGFVEKVFHQPFNIAASGVLTRCVKDKAAENVIW